MASDAVQFSVNDTSPTISYSPFADTLGTPNLTAGWNPYFDYSGFVSALGESGNGTSFHVTSLDGASVQIQWQGTSIQLLGNTTNARFSIDLDGLQFQQSSHEVQLADDVLVSIDGLDDTPHLLTLTMHALSDTATNPLVFFHSAVIDAPPPSSFTNLTFSQQTIDDSQVKFFGNWESGSSSGHQSTTAGDQAQFRFLGTTLLVLGSTSPNAGNYSVSLDGDKRFFSGISSFTQPDNLLFFSSGLDPSIAHTVIITNEDGSSLVLQSGGVSSFSAGSPIPPVVSSTTSASPGATSSNSILPTVVKAYPSGTIAALALAGVLAFVLLTGLLYLFLVYRPRQRRRRRDVLERRRLERKGQDTASILDIGPDNIHGDTESGKEKRQRRASGRSGFRRWKAEMEGGAGLGMLGIKFRHSESIKREASSVHNGQDRVEAAYSEGISNKESPRATQINKGKGKWLGLHKKTSPPSFTLDLPPISPRRSRSQSNAGSNRSVLSYVSGPPTPILNVSSHDAHRSDREWTQTRQRASTMPNTHSRAESRGFLLRPETSGLEQNYDSDTQDYPGYVPPPQEDRGSVRDYDDNMSVLGPMTALAAIRGLSPRTSETSSAPEAVQASSQFQWPSGGGRPVPQPSEFPSMPSQDPEQRLSRTAQFVYPPSYDRPGRRISRQTRLSGLSHVRFEGFEEEVLTPPAELSDQGRSIQVTSPLTQARADLRPQPGHPTRGPREGRATSFLDFSGSSDASIVTHSNDTSQSSERSGPYGLANQPRSRWSSTTAPSSTHRDHEASESSTDSQSPVQSSRASSTFPFPVSLPASPHHPEGFKPSPPRQPAELSRDIGEPSGQHRVHSHPLEVFASSPSDSVPLSVHSDVNFRHSDAEDNQEELSSSASYLPRHPPLPSQEQIASTAEDVTTPTYGAHVALAMASSSRSRVDSHVRSPVTPTARDFPQQYGQQPPKEE